MELYLWIILVVPVLSFKTSKEVSHECFYKYSPNDCAYNVTCVDNTNIYIEDFDILPPNTEFLCNDYININDIQYLPVHVVYRRQSYDDMYGIMWSNSYPAVYAVVELNLSNNQFKVEPTLDLMPNLRCFNISHNSLTAAKLSNKIEYSHLEQIDFSHNTIMHLQFDVDDYVYVNLKILDLSHNLIGIIPEEFFIMFPKIEYIDLSYNHLINLNKASFDGVNNLLSLNIDHNDIIDINSSLLNLNNLQELSLKQNRIEEVLTKDFQNLSKLVKLDLSSNEISHIDIDVFDNMTLLQNLNLSKNYLDHIYEKSFNDKNDLDSVDLSKNKLRLLPKELFIGRNLSLFSVQNNLIGELARGMFYGLHRVASLDVSNQNVTSIGDYAFVGLSELEKLLLNKNKIRSVSKNAFRTLDNIKLLDLSNNFLITIDFEMDDLVQLQFLFLRFNLLMNVKKDVFISSPLKVLDLSYNDMLEIDNKIFKDLLTLEKLMFTSDYPLLYSKAFFDRSSSLIEIDVSYSRIPSVKNYTFMDMRRLEFINMSHCFIKHIEFYSFRYTASVSTIDLSYNKLTDFVIDTSSLQKLEILLLNNNLFNGISDNTFKNLPLLRELNLSHNLLENIDEEAFKDQSSLTNLDISFNNFTSININFLVALKNLKRINLSGVSGRVNFTIVKSIRLIELHMSYAYVQNVTSLCVGKLKRLENLSLSNNKITFVDRNSFSEAIRLRNLDLSHNNIQYIQPGTFLRNFHLNTLNISHNLLTVFRYGTFRGLIRLNNLDISYNRLVGLKDETLNEIENVASLTIDGNRLQNIDYVKLSKSSITKLSIGENDIPCSIISKLIQYLNFEITARIIDQYSGNVLGIPCSQ